MVQVFQGMLLDPIGLCAQLLVVRKLIGADPGPLTRVFLPGF